MTEYFWVPENCVFTSDCDCLDAFPDHGAAAMVASHVAYDKLKAENGQLHMEGDQLRKRRNELKEENKRLREALEKIAEPGSEIYDETSRDHLSALVTYIRGRAHLALKANGGE